MSNHRAPTIKNRHDFSKYVPSRETVIKLTAAAAFLTAAIFGASKMHEGFARTDYSYDLSSQDDNFGEVANDIATDTLDTFVDLSLGVGGLGTAGLIATGGILWYRRNGEATDLGYVENYVDPAPEYPEDDVYDQTAELPPGRYAVIYS